MGPIYPTTGFDRGSTGTGMLNRSYYAEVPEKAESTEAWVRDVEEYLAAKANGSDSSH